MVRKGGKGGWECGHSISIIPPYTTAQSRAQVAHDCMAHGCNTKESHYSKLSHGTTVVCNYGQIHYVIAEISMEYLPILAALGHGKEFMTALQRRAPRLSFPRYARRTRTHLLCLLSAPVPFLLPNKIIYIKNVYIYILCLYKYISYNTRSFFI